MIINFEKKDTGEIVANINEKEFNSTHYVEMIKELYDSKSIDCKYSNDITKEEQDLLSNMVDDINQIKNNLEQENSVENYSENSDMTDYGDTDINPDDIPF